MHWKCLYELSSPWFNTGKLVKVYGSIDFWLEVDTDIPKRDLTCFGIT